MDGLTEEKELTLKPLLEGFVDDKSLIGMIMSAVKSTKTANDDLKITQFVVAMKKSKIKQKNIIMQF